MAVSLGVQNSGFDFRFKGRMGGGMFEANLDDASSLNLCPLALVGLAKSLFLHEFCLAISLCSFLLGLSLRCLLKSGSCRPLVRMALLKIKRLLLYHSNLESLRTYLGKMCSHSFLLFFFLEPELLPLSLPANVSGDALRELTALVPHSVMVSSVSSYSSELVDSLVSPC